MMLYSWRTYSTRSCCAIMFFKGFMSRMRTRTIFWFSLSLTFAVIYAIPALQQAFSSEYVVQDDARQHVFWMQQFLDRELFPNDWIANYFQSVAPAGYTTLYQAMARLGIEPVVFSKLLPLGLSLIITSYGFGVCLEMLPVPVAGFISTLLLNQTLWMRDDLVSATPRAFVYPLLLAFSYYLLQQKLLPCLGAIALQGLFYPQSVFICAGILIVRLFSPPPPSPNFGRGGVRIGFKGGGEQENNFGRGRVRISFKGGGEQKNTEVQELKSSKNSELLNFFLKRDYRFCLAGLGVALLVMLPYALSTSQFGPVISVTEAKGMAEFWPGGRSSFFNDNFWEFWLNRDRSSILPRRQSLPILLYAALLLPLLLRYPSRFPLSQQVKGGVSLLLQIVIVSLSLFFTAHILLFKLHLPSRYTEHTLRIVLCLAAGIALVIIWNGVLFWSRQASGRGIQAIAPGLAIAFTTVLFALLILYPSFLKNFPKTSYEVGEVPALYQFFSQQPKDSLIASLSPEADNLPTFSLRSVLVSKEYAIPYHTGYYQQFRQRAIDLIEAQYSPNLAVVQRFIQKYGIDFWLLDQAAFTSAYITNSWMQQFQPAAIEAQASINKGTVPALAGLMESCSVFKSEQSVVLEVECIDRVPPRN